MKSRPVAAVAFALARLCVHSCGSSRCVGEIVGEDAFEHPDERRRILVGERIGQWLGGADDFLVMLCVQNRCGDLACDLAGHHSGGAAAASGGVESADLDPVSAAGPDGGEPVFAALVSDRVKVR
jgi:hypothetical protein